MSGPAHAFVLGGGAAGLAAAFGLRDRGFAVTVLESHGWLGGRAFSFDDGDGAARRRLDNGPHVLLGCYRDFGALLRRLGSDACFDRHRSLRIAYRLPDGRAAALALRRLPVALAIGPALLRLPLGGRGKWQALRGLLAVLRATPADWTLQDWLQRRGQLGAPASFFWLPLCRAVMNVEPEEASAALFLATLREAFAGSAASGAFWIPTRPWGEILGDAAAVALPQAGIAVRCGTRVQALATADGAVTAIGLGTGERVAVGPGDLVVSALPWHALAPLLPSPPAFAAIATAPIVSLHCELAADAPLLPDDGPVVALVDGAPFHFVCRTPGADPRRFTLLAGGCRQFDGVPVAAIAAQGREQLERFYGVSLPAAALRTRVAKEARATITPSPSNERLRPRPGPLPAGPRNLWVCGDWTACGLPSTLEGAARSARLLLEALAPGHAAVSCPAR